MHFQVSGVIWAAVGTRPASTCRSHTDRTFEISRSMVLIASIEHLALNKQVQHLKGGPLPLYYAKDLPELAHPAAAQQCLVFCACLSSERSKHKEGYARFAAMFAGVAVPRHHHIAVLRLTVDDTTLIVYVLKQTMQCVYARVISDRLLLTAARMLTLRDM